MVTDVVVLLVFISRRDAEDCVAARRELKAFHFNGILKSKCLATQKNFVCFRAFRGFKKPRIPSVSPFSGKSHYVCSVFRRRPERERQIRVCHA